MAGPFAVLHEAVTVLDASGGQRGRLQLWSSTVGFVLRFGGALEVLVLRVEERAVSLKTHR